MNPELHLRDIHLPPEPSWWPPAPGWWFLAALILGVVVLLARTLWRRRIAQRGLAALLGEFDAAAALPEPAARVAAISALLRRAARRRDPAAATLRGEDWLRFLDACEAGTKRDEKSASVRAFSNGAGRALLDGAYRARLDPEAANALVEPARRCFQLLLESR
jgi:hypothetical protein